MNIPLGDTEAVKWIDGGTTYDLEKLVLNGTTIWELATDITGTAVYNPTSRAISMDVTLGNLDSWSWRAQKSGGGGDTGENAVSGVSYAESSELGVSDDGTWTVTFKGFLNGTHRSTHQVSVVVATPFIEITSVEELSGGGGVNLTKNVSCGTAPVREKFAGLQVQGYGANYGQRYYSGWSSGDTYNISDHGGTVGYSVKYIAKDLVGVSPSNYTDYLFRGEGTTIWNKGSGLNASTVLSKLNSDFNKFSTQSGVGKNGVLPHTTGSGWLMDLSWSGVTVDSNGGLTGVCCDGLDWSNNHSQDVQEGSATPKGLRRFALLFGSSGGVYNAVLREATTTTYPNNGFIYGDDDRTTLIGYQDWNATLEWNGEYYEPAGTATLYNVEDFLTEFRTVNNLPSTEDFAIIECHGAVPYYSSGGSSDDDD